MPTITSDKVKTRAIEHMGDDLGSIYHIFWNELAWLNFKWGEFVELYGTSPDRVEILNKAAGHFFLIVQETLLQDILLHICRLTDSPKSSEKDNLTIKILPEYINDKEFKARLSQLVEIADQKSKFCRDRRNRRIAHHDLGIALKTDATPLQEVTRKKVIDALNSLSEVLNAISMHYLDTQVMYNANIGGDAINLLDLLEDGLAK